MLGKVAFDLCKRLVKVIPYPLGNFGVISGTIDHPVGMAYLLGNLATDRRATAVARQPDSNQSVWLSIV